MNCRDAIRLLDGYVDAELDAAGVLAVEEHVRTCPRCRTHHANLKAVQAAVRRHAEPRDAPAPLRARLEAHYGRERAPGMPGTHKWLWFAAPGLAALLLVTSWIGFGEYSRNREQRPARVVAQISQSGFASAALRSLANHLQTAPGARIVVVAHNNGVDFLLRGARDESGQLFEIAVAGLQARGVEFRICGNTLVRRQFAAGQVIAAASLVESGVVEISRLQSEEGYAYLGL